MTTDLDLLGQYARQNAQEAFAELVRRHVNLVYSAALRQVRSPQLAEEVAQSVFADLARNADRLKPDTILTAWLYQVARCTAIDVVRKESRRQLREQIAVEMNTMNASSNDWTQIEPLIDEAMDALDETDRSAILLRYFENKNLREVGAVLGTSDDAAQKRVSRAVERLREFFSKRNVTIGASGLAVVISANAVQAAPVGLVVTISTATLTGTSVSASTVIATTKAIASSFTNSISRGCSLRSGGHPACRGAGLPAWRIKPHAYPRAQNFRESLKLRSPIPGGGTPTLHGRRGVRRYIAFAAMSRRKCAPSKWILSTAA
jgi:RNA polymerase sigma factor (sigma-70 family)